MLHTVDLDFKGNKKSIAAYILETSDGPVIIESGPYSTFPVLKKALENNGFAVSDVKHVFLTHVHLDHAGAAWAFANEGATVYVHPKGIKHLSNPERLWNSAKMIYQDKMEELWGDMQPIPESQLRVVEHGEEITVGDATIQAWHTPGHAKHHIAWQWGTTLFTGDVGGVRIDGGLIEPPTPPPDINLDNWYESIGIIEQLKVERFMLTHFGEVNDVTTHLANLKDQLKNWSQWMKPHWEAGKPAEEIIPEFSAFVKKQLRSKGADEELVNCYEAANPSWMSVSGLLRYWQKKHEAAG
jgi:glyoxylase-like metal-dependent hydrolase (beta-lactamase superfamily II)